MAYPGVPFLPIFEYPYPPAPCSLHGYCQVCGSGLSYAHLPGPKRPVARRLTGSQTFWLMMYWDDWHGRDEAESDIAELYSTVTSSFGHDAAIVKIESNSLGPRRMPPEVTRYLQDFRQRQDALFIWLYCGHGMGESGTLTLHKYVEMSCG